jgi:hypothetical protein
MVPMKTWEDPQLRKTLRLISIGGPVLIDSYQFGKIVIDGQEYSNDVMIHSDGRVDKWWRREGHIVALQDIETLLQESPEVLIVGAGLPGMMSLPGGLITYLQDKGVHVIYDRTDRAIETYNTHHDSKRTAAVFHITC